MAAEVLGAGVEGDSPRRAPARACVQGGAAVQSTASRAPAACAASAAAAMSITSQVGLVGVSIQSSRVRPGRSAASSAPGAAASKKLTSIPRRSARRRSQERPPWYMIRGAATWSPAVQRLDQRHQAPPCRWRRPAFRPRRRDRRAPPRHARPSGRRRGRRCSSGARRSPRPARRCVESSIPGVTAPVRGSIWRSACAARVAGESVSCRGVSVTGNARVCVSREFERRGGAWQGLAGGEPTAGAVGGSGAAMFRTWRRRARAALRRGAGGKRRLPGKRLRKRLLPQDASTRVDVSRAGLKQLCFG